MKVAVEPTVIPVEGRGKRRNSLVAALNLITRRGVILPTCSTLQTFNAAHTGPNFIANGVGLFILEDLLRLARTYCSSSGKELESFRIYDLVEHVIKPLTSFSKCSYVELLLGSISNSNSGEGLVNRRSRRVGLGAYSLSLVNKYSKHVSNKANIYVVFAYDFFLVDLISALARHKKSDNVDGSRQYFFWLDFINTNFWDTKSLSFGVGKQPAPTDMRPVEPTGRLRMLQSLGGSSARKTAASSTAEAHFAQANGYTIPHSVEWYAHDLPAFMGHVGHVLVLLLPWSAPLVLCRSWCLVELLAAYTIHPCSSTSGMLRSCSSGSSNSVLRFSVGLSERRHDEFIKILCNDFERGLGILIDNVAIDVENSLCNNYMTRTEHMGACRAMVGAHGFAEVNACVARLLTAWAVGVCESHHTGQLAQHKRRLQQPSSSMMCRWGERRRQEVVAQLHLQECHSLYALCNLRVLGKDFTRAEQGFAEVLQQLVACGHGDDDDPMVMSVRGNLALAHQRQGRLEEALTAAQPLLLRKRRLYGDLHPSTVTTMHNTALLLVECGGMRAAQGLQLYLEVVAAKSTALGPYHAETLQASAHLCSLYHGLGKHDECALVLQEAIRVRSTVFGPRAACLLPLYDLLIGLRQQVTRTHKPVHPLWFELHHSRPRAAPTGDQQCAFLELLGYYNEAMAIHEHAFGRESMVALSFAKKYAQFLIENELFEQCLQHFQQVHDTECALLGREHPSTMDSLDTLVNLFCRGGRHGAALPLAIEAVALRRAIFDDKSSEENNKALIDAMFVVGSLYTALQRYSEAVEIYRSVLVLQRAAYGSAAKQTLVTHYYLACDEAHMHEYEAAFEHFQVALGGFDALFAAGAEGWEEEEEGKGEGATDNYWSASSAMSMARLCRTVGNYTLAEELARRALHYYTQQHGSQHDIVTETISFVNSLYSQHKKSL